jgi:hypothetical protein
MSKILGCEQTVYLRRQADEIQVCEEEEQTVGILIFCAARNCMVQVESTAFSLE